MTGKDMQFFLGNIPDGSLAAQVMRAAADGHTGYLANLLHRMDVLPDFINMHGITPLMAAAARGHAEIVELLAAHPLVNLGRQTPDGWTALHYAAHFGQEAAVRSLIAHHAPLDVAMKSGELPHMVAEESPWQRISGRAAISRAS